MNIKGIIFDMDNTILRSKIDFNAMKQETFHFLVARAILPSELDLTNHTSSTIIEKALETQLMTDHLIQEMWEIPKKFEMIGMENADLEPGALELLNELKGKYCMVILTNNSIDAAITALSGHGILDLFDCVIGRELVSTMKPSPAGFLHILDRYRSLPASEWISVGDAWVDGKASAAAGIEFISYQGDRDKMKRMGVFPRAEIQELSELRKHIPF